MGNAQDKPKLIGELGVWPLFPGVFFVGNKTVDGYVRVPEPALPAVRHALGLLDGEHTVAQVKAETQCAGWQMDVEHLLAQLGKAGLLEDVKRCSDFEAMSVTWMEINLRRCFPAAYPWRMWGRCGVLLAGSLLVLAGWLSLGGGHVVRESLAATPGQVVVASLLGALVSVLVHEGAHALTAAGYGLTPRCLQVVAYCGVLPYFVVRIPGIYTLPPGKRIVIWSAGPMASLTLSAFSWLLLLAHVGPLSVRWWLWYLYAINLLVFAWNLCPLLLTDGYFVMSTLLRQSNLRWRAWRMLFSDAWRGRHLNWLLLGYGAASSAFLLFLFLRGCRRILQWPYGWPFLKYSILTFLLLVSARKFLAQYKHWRLAIRGKLT
jgi:hypothetical protein